MLTPDIVEWINQDLNYTRPGWKVSAAEVPCPHVDVDGQWPVLFVSYVEADTTPGGTGAPFPQTRTILIDPRLVGDADDLAALVFGHILWSVIHEERERFMVNGAQPYFPHHTATRETWDARRGRVLAQVD